MSPAERYDLLQSLLLRARALGTASDSQLDALLAEMDTAWDAMSPADQAAADARAAALASTAAPDELGITDVVQVIGDHRLPRRAGGGFP